jgi:LPXTG-motif cell wall-anchored protein
VPPGPGASAKANTRSSGGIASGNNIQIPINIGIDLCGNNVKAASVKDVAGGGNCGTQSGSSASSTTSHSGGIGSGNNVQAPVNVPVLACDNTVGGVLVKDALGSADCTAGGSGPSSAPGGSGGASSTAQTDHSGGILSGNIVQAPVNVPVNACGNQVNAVSLQNTESGADCTNNAEGSAPTLPGAPAPGSGGASATAVSVDNGGIGSGTTVQLPINVPVNLCGNSADGAAFESKVAGGECQNTGSATAILGSSGNKGLITGNSVQTPIQVPVNACGTEVVAAADQLDDQKPDCAATSSGGNTPPGSTAINVSSNNGGIGSGNSAQTPIYVPVNACGVNGTAADLHNGQTAPECTTTGQITTVSVTSNNGGIGSGNNVPVQVNVPVQACGDDVNAVKGPGSAAECENTPSTPPTTPTAPPTTPTAPPTTPTAPPTTPTAPPTTPSTPPTSPSTPPTGPTTPSTPPTGPSTPATPPTGPTTATTPPNGPSTPPGQPGQPGNATPPPANLAHTGVEDLGIGLGVAGGALAGGLGLLVATRRRRESE